MKRPLVSILGWPQWHTGIITVHAVPHCSLCPVIKIESDCWLWFEEKNSWGNSSTASHRSKLAHICASFLWLSAAMWSWMSTDWKGPGSFMSYTCQDNWTFHTQISFKNSRYVEERDSSLPKYKVTFWFLVLVQWVYIQDRTHLAAAYSDEALALITVFNKKIYMQSTLSDWQDK